jgi:hypothetical protein
MITMLHITPISPWFMILILITIVNGADKSLQSCGAHIVDSSSASKITIAK